MESNSEAAKEERVDSPPLPHNASETNVAGGDADSEGPSQSNMMRGVARQQLCQACRVCTPSVSNADTKQLGRPHEASISCCSDGGRKGLSRGLGKGECLTISTMRPTALLALTLDVSVLEKQLVNVVPAADFPSSGFVLVDALERAASADAACAASGEHDAAHGVLIRCGANPLASAAHETLVREVNGLLLGVEPPPAVPLPAIPHARESGAALGIA